MKYNTKEKIYVLKIGTKLAIIYNEGAKKITLNYAYKLPAKSKMEAEKEFPKLLKKIFKCKGVDIPKSSLRKIKELKPINKNDIRPKEFRDNAEADSQAWLDKYYPVTL